MVPNFGVSAVVNRRTGRYCTVPHVRASAPVRIQNIRFNSLSINGPRVFNSLPLHLRNMSDCSVTTFKGAVDKYLALVPDQPRVKKMIPHCAHSSNSLTSMRATNWDFYDHWASMRNDICICMKNFVALSVFCFAVLFISQQGRSRDDGPALLGRHWRRGAAGGDAMDRAIGETANSKNSK